MSKISIEDIKEFTGNLYESLSIVSKRARQVNDNQKRELDKNREEIPREETRELEDFDEVEIDRDALMREHIKIPKPSRIAINEMVEKKIQFEYKEDGQLKEEPS